MIKLVKCNHCGNIAEYVIDSGVPVVCCGEKMEVLTPQTADSSTEKHVPVVEQNGNIVKVTVGSTLHPMMEKHHICFIYLETEEGIYRKDLDPAGEPIAEFAVRDGEKVIAAYEYCNLHGFWMNEL